MSLAPMIQPLRMLLSCCVLMLMATTASAQSGVDAKLRELLPASIKQSNVVKIGSPMAFPPNVYIDNDKLVGVAVEMSRAMEPLLGVKFEWQDMKWPGIIPGLQGGTIDLSWGIMSYLPERTSILNIIPFNKDLVGVMVQPGAKGIDGSTASWCGRSIAGLQGTNYANYTEAASKRCVDAGKPPIKHQIYNNGETALIGFQSNSVEAMVTSYFNMLRINQAGGSKYQTFVVNDFPNPPLSIATSKANVGLAQAIERGMAILHANGTYKRIFDKYGMGEAALTANEIRINP